VNATADLRQTSAAHPEDVARWLRTHVGARAQLRLDSRTVQAGDVFVACPGQSSDGRRHIDDAVRRGAAAVVLEAPDDGATAQARDDVAMLPVTRLRGMLGALADDWYGRPSAALTVIAITGTNGKTSCAQWIASALTHGGKPCGSIGTLGAVLPDGQVLPGTLTTPDVLEMHRLLATMRDGGAQAVALEASSIGIEQGRLDGVRIGIASFTNLTRDHLDYHGSMQAYEAAKARLFAWPGLSRAVVNADDEAGQRLIAALPLASVVSFSMRESAAVHARDLSATSTGQIFTLVTRQGEAQIMTGLMGAHNVANLLLVAGVLMALGWPLADIARELSAAAPVRGRLEIVEAIAAPSDAIHGAATSAGSTAPGASHGAQAALVIVDYAHTPDALERALLALRPVAQARGGMLHCLFGCGGERDAGKRPVMGAIAATHADRVVITSDNPRGEDADAIIAQIVAGLPAGARYEVQAERARAIMHTVWSAAPADVVLLAGKGHETYQEIGGKRLPFDDREWARLALLLPTVAAVSSDTRSVRRGELFLALVGERFDGHDYLNQAAAAGACAAVVARPVPGSPLPQLVLGDTGVALMRMGAAWRARFDIPVIAVTGSNGKTTTKEMISAILAEWLGEDERLATAGNYNNEIGVPLTLLRLRPRHRAAVLELGMNHPGEIAVLADLARPTIALVNNAQREHQEFMQSVEAVAHENGAVLAVLPRQGVAVFPGDEPYAGIWGELNAAERALRFGLRPDLDLDVHAANIAASEEGSVFDVVADGRSERLALPVPGLHNVRNALAAIASTLAAGAPLAVACRALAGFEAVSGRMQRHRTRDGALLIDDTYNANPDSVRAAIDVLAQLTGPRILVLGDMGEVGANGPAMHREVGAYARERGIDALVTLGEASRAAGAAYGAQARVCESVEEVVAAVSGIKAASILVKGSRFMRMERVVKVLMSSGAGLQGAEEPRKPQAPGQAGGEHAA
jgi:murE/murF fusion protein